MNAPLRPGLPPLPERMRDLPVDDRGYPIPEFVSHIDGRRDFRVVSLDHLAKCVREDVCWICGQPLEELKAFVIGPLPALQAISNEPPSHIECAQFAVAACPFLLLPKAQHRPNDDPRVRKMVGATKGNPGVSCMYVVRGYSCYESPKGVIFRTGRAVRVAWFTQGRPAERSEVRDAIEASLRTLPHVGPAMERRVAELLSA